MQERMGWKRKDWESWPSLLVKGPFHPETRVRPGALLGVTLGLFMAAPRTAPHQDYFVFSQA